uniref:Chaperone protein DnaK n=1 Tax=Gloeochaete wittrockiana TaxID=38269 RepID=A0A3G1IW06_9EUKA|nr:heat shock protein 70 [Gloeochaete wittrockiana]ASQ40238.1 heat shock protein 70 [Gloeochaete wittrockiana]
MAIKKVIGIDLGTTNSVVAGMEGGKATVIPNREGGRITPSIVAYTQKGDKMVGVPAKRQAALNPENTFYSIKRFMGRTYKEVLEDAKKVPYSVTGTQNVKLECPALGKLLSPEEISAEILRKLTEDASSYFGEPVKQVVVTVPAYFNDSQRQATKDAGKIAGLEVLRIINEPTAASLAYGLDKKKNETILVFDLGGGTFDVSVLEVADGVFEVLATSGDTHLGGDDFNFVLVDYMIEDFKKREGIDLRNNKQALQRFTEAAEAAKIELSGVSQSDITLPFIAQEEGRPLSYECTITRTLFEELSAHLIDKCRIPLETAFQDAKLDKKDIDEVVLVGGSTRIPAVKNFVEKFCGKTPNQSVNPDEVVALGAAIQGGVLAGEVKDILLLDVIPLSLGVETLGEVMTKMIPKNTTIPTRKSEIFSTSADDQTLVEIHVLQGERQFVKDNKSLGTFKLDGISPSPRGVPQIEVTFDIDANGILSVTAKDKGTGKENSITIAGASTLSKDEVERMIEEAEKNATLDQERLKKIELKNNADALIYQVSRILKDNQNVSNREELEKLKTDLENAINQENFDVVASLSEELKQSIIKSQTLNPSSTDKTNNKENNSNDDDVIDATFTEKN